MPCDPLPQNALLVLGASQEHIPLYEEARRRGMPTIAVDMRADAPAFPFADAALEISTRDAGAIVDALGDVRPAGIVGGASDAALATWHTLGVRYDAPYVYPKDAFAGLDKAAFHAAVASCGITDYGWVASSDPDEVVAKAAGLPLPLVVKPVDGSGSKGVTLVAHPDDLPAAVAHARVYSASQTVIAEECVEGRQLTIDLFLRGGRSMMTCVKELEFVAGSVVRRICTVQLSPEEDDHLEASAERLCRAWGIVDGPANFDLVLGADGQARIIEADPRLSGDSIPRLLAAAYGVNVVGALVALTLGEPLDGHLLATRNEHAAVELVGSQLVTDGELVAWDGVVAARSVPGITDVVLYAEPGDLVRPHDQSGHKIGMVVAAGPSVADVSLALETAGALVRPIVRPVTVAKGES
ncbi:ATP-grasp domain-containing protein [Streptomyces sp. ITFR-6]|uniref:ATP-grasp domain-containing protein n=1 Tax=Streptomyces sp. ITFR-6 TaxID=3075197 RepID=UPI00288B1094|nr:ATP-grasp domain-containing protein [Streptomyces sp. ITFR-6]WNI34141.1 ATP-grasp domain-containing protein [Streptomyces sp. ITFR-6]